MKEPALLVGLAFLGCAACVERSADNSTNVVTLTERYVTGLDPALNIDSVATYAGAPDASWLFATAKEGNVIRIYNASTGALVRDLGSTGVGSFEFRRPNGILTLDGMLVVVERDNHRVQVFDLPELETVGIFGDSELVKPYGAYMRSVGADRYELYVTDNYETADEQVPPESELGRRVHLFTIDVIRDDGGAVHAINAAHTRAFGATSGPGALRVVESLWGDPEHDRLMIAEEDPAGGRVIKGYSFAGQFSGEIVGAGVFEVQPEGIALYRCADGAGYWITTDQSDGRNVFHLFDRRSLAHAGAFQGATTRNTDGVWLSQEPLPGFPAGAFFAVHDDQAVAAFDWRDIASELGLTDCSS
jgi:3-phytase